jgi:BON domain
MPRPLRLLVLALLLCAGACAARTAPTLADAEASMRVKTALLNDPQLGTEDIRVEVRLGVAHLRGRISAPGQEARIVALVRGVPGIRDVETAFQVTPHVGALERRLPIVPEAFATERGRLIGVGVGVRFVRSGGSEVGDGVSVAPLIRLGAGKGFGPAIGFGWTSRELLGSASTSAAPLADLRVRPVMVGVGYSYPVGRAQLSASLVGGYAFTRLRADRSAAGPNRAIAVDNAFALRPAATLWIDTSKRLGFQVSAGYLVARPRVTFASDDRVYSTRVRADALMVSVGGAWWVF